MTGSGRRTITGLSLRSEGTIARLRHTLTLLLRQAMQAVVTCLRFEEDFAEVDMAVNGKN